MKLSNEKKYKLTDLIDGLDATISGNADCLITGISPIQQSQKGHITLLTNSLYRKHLSMTSASAVILSEKDAKGCPITAVVSQNPYYTYAKIAAFFSDDQNFATDVHGVHPSAIVGENSLIARTATISAHCVVGKNCRIADGVVLGPGCVIGDAVEIDEGTHVEANVTLYHHVKIGKRTRLASGVVIGSDGFGFANQEGAWHKVPQLGGVIIGDDVEIGANTTIDRGAIEDTIIGKGVKLDNLIQIGHNVEVGDHSIIAGCVAIAGSTVIGKNCMIGGATCFAGHLRIADNTVITGMTAVTKSILKAGIYSSGIVGAVPNHEFRKNNARFHRLENLIQRVKKLELQLKEATERKT